MTEATETHEVLRRYLGKLLDAREPPKTICPSEVARALSPEELRATGVHWRELMPEIRNMVAEMRDRGEVEVLQKGVVLTGDLGEGLINIKGPVRVRRIT